MRGKITLRSVNSLGPGDADVFLWDTDLKGFGLKVTPNGKKVYIVQYRTGGRNSPTRRHTIGQHGSPWTPEEAREAAGRLVGVVALGGDPATAKAADKKAPTVEALAKRFLAEHVNTKTKPRTAAEYKRLLDKIILPALKNRRVCEVTRADVSRLHHAYRDTLYDANRSLAVLSKMFNLAEKWGERPDGSNPCRHVEKYAERKRERMLSAEELARLGEALIAAAEGKLKASLRHWIRKQAKN